MFKSHKSSNPGYLAQQPTPRIFAGDLPAKEELTDLNLLTKAADTNSTTHKPFDSELDRQLDADTQTSWERFESQLGVNLAEPIDYDSLIVASMIAASRGNKNNTTDNLESARQLDANTQAAWDNLPVAASDGGPKANLDMFA